MRTDAHIWRTADGRHVPAGHRDAAVLAYAAGDYVPDAVIDELTADTKRPKSRRKPADKAKAKPADKAGSGLTITKLGDDADDEGKADAGES